MRSEIFRVARFALLSVIVLFPVYCLSQNAHPLPGASQPAQPSASTPKAIPDDVSAAESAIAGSDWKTAESKLDAFLTAHPTDARALFDAGYVADAQNRLDDAAALYRRAIAANPRSFESHLSLGLLLARQNKSAEARPDLVAAATLDSDADPALKARAWRALAGIDRESDPAGASNDLLEALKLSPETTADTLLAAELAERTGQADAAESAYRRVLATEPDSAPATIGLAQLLIQQKQFPDAETLLRAAVDKHPDDPTLNAQLATVLADQDKAEALPLLQKLHTAHPQDDSITRMLAAVLADAGNFASSDHLYLQLLASHPDDTDLLVAHGQNLVRQAQLDDAFKIFDKATQIDPASADGWSGLAFAASRTHRPGVTLHALAMRSRYLSENASTLFLWATAYDATNQKREAATYYHRFLDAAAGKFPDQEWQARQRLKLLEK